jgi:hypothetical protein
MIKARGRVVTVGIDGMKGGQHRGEEGGGHGGQGGGGAPGTPGGMRKKGGWLGRLG